MRILLVIAFLPLISALSGPTVTTRLSVPNGELIDTVERAKSDPNRLWLVTRSGSLYRSVDGGTTWTNEKVDDVVFIKIHEENANIVYFGTLTGGAFTRDGGETYKEAGVGLLDVVYHPQDENKVLELRASIACVSELFSLTECFKELWLTTDGGETFKRITTYVQRAEWASTLDSETNEDAIFATMWPVKTGGHFDQSLEDLSMVLTLDYFETPPQQIAPNTYTFLINNRFLVAAVEDTKSDNSKELALLVDVNGTFVCAELPFSSSPESFTLFQWEDGYIMLAVRSSTSTTGSIYISDSSGTMYSSSLWNVYSDGSHRYDLVTIRDKVLIANQVDFVGAERRTLRSFDRGITWSVLSSDNITGLPHEGHTGAGTGHGYIVLKEKSRPSGSDDAPGYVVATFADGNEFIPIVSRDDGSTWHVLSGAFHHSMSSEFRHSVLWHGSITVITSDETIDGTGDVFWSYTEGKTMNSSKTPGTPDTDEMFELLSSKKMERPSALLVTNKYVIEIDFTSAEMPDCNFPDDYELYEPLDPIDGDGCLLGHQEVFHRRKQDVVCHDVTNVTSQVNVTLCACHEHDYECATGFQSESLTSTTCEQVYVSPPATCPVGSSYEAPVYAKVAGDLCEGTVALATETKTTECPVGFECGTCENGDCVSGSCHAQCKCKVGFLGANCEIATGVCEALCLNGKCITHDHCAYCDPGYNGRYCEERVDRLLLGDRSKGISSTVAVIVAIVTTLFVGFFAMVIFYLCWSSRKKKQAAAAAGTELDAPTAESDVEVARPANATGSRRSEIGANRPRRKIKHGEIFTEFQDEVESEEAPDYAANASISETSDTAAPEEHGSSDEASSSSGKRPV